MPTYPGMQGPLSNVLNTEVAKAIFELSVAWSRDFAREIYTGNPTNNTSGGGRQYFYGLDTLINTGYRDAITGVACPAADSIVRLFGNLDIATNGATLVRQITNIYRNLRYIASNAGLDPVRGRSDALAMFTRSPSVAVRSPDLPLYEHCDRQHRVRG